MMDARTLKLIALITMVLDHFAASVLYLMAQQDKSLEPAYNVLRHIGRVAFPIYGFLLVEGFIYTKNLLRYMLSVLLCAVISEIPFNLVVSGGDYFDIKHQNVFISLFISLAVLALIERVLERYGARDMMRYDLTSLIIALGSLLACLVKCDYRHGGVLMIAGMYLIRRLIISSGTPSFNMYRAFIELMTAALIMTIYNKREVYAFAAALPVIFYNGRRGNIKHKYFYYLAYPVHLLVLGLIARAMKLGYINLM